MNMKHLVLFFFSWLLLLEVTIIQAAGAESTTTPFRLAELGKQKALAEQLYRYSTSQVEPTHIRFWLKQLDNNDYLPTDASWSSKVKVRDVAVLSLEAITGMEFFPALGSSKRQTVAEIISYKAGDEVFRYSVTVYDDEQIRRIRFAVHCWNDGYTKGLEARTTGAKLKGREQKR